MKTIYRVLIVIVAFNFGCGTSKYSKELISYLHELKIDFSESNDSLILIPLNGCQVCIDGAINEILADTSLAKPFLLFIGEVIPPRVLADPGISYFHDSLNLIRKYQTNIYEPVRVVFKDKKVIYEPI